MGGAGRTRECRPNCLSNCLVTVFSTRTGSAQVKLCIKQFGSWVELVVPGSAGQTVCQTVWSQSSQHGQALLRSNYASNSLVHGWSWSYQRVAGQNLFVKLFGHSLLNTDRLCSGQTMHQTVWFTGWSWSYLRVPAKLFVKLFGHSLLNTDRLCSGQTMRQTVWLLGGAGRTRECRPNRLSNCLVTVFSTRTGSAQVKLCIKQFGSWVELVVPGSAGQIVGQTVWSQSSQHGQALLRSNYASNSLVTGWTSWSYH